MSTTEVKTPTEYFATLKAAIGAETYQEMVLGAVYDNADVLEEAYEALLEEAEEAGDDEEFALAADSFRKLSVMAWAQDDSRMVENFSIQALYYGVTVNFDILLKNYSTTWSMWAHLLPKLKPRERARLQDFARFNRSFQLGLRKREDSDERLVAAVSLLAPTFDNLGELNLRKIDDRRADITDDTAALWGEVEQLLAQIEKAPA